MPKCSRHEKRPYEPACFKIRKIAHRTDILDRELPFFAKGKYVGFLRTQCEIQENATGIRSWKYFRCKGSGSAADTRPGGDCLNTAEDDVFDAHVQEHHFLGIDFPQAQFISAVSYLEQAEDDIPYLLSHPFHEFFRCDGPHVAKNGAESSAGANLA